jgi:hypothetical protein
VANIIEITDKDGWRKEFQIRKTITHIGCDAANDMVLEPLRGAGVLPRHVQLITGNGLFRLVNIGNVEFKAWQMGDSPREIQVSPFSAIDLQNGMQIKLGDFRLKLSLDEGTPALVGESALPNPATLALTAAGSQTNGSGNGNGTTQPPGDGNPFIIGAEVIGLKLKLSRAVLTPNQPLIGTVAVRNRGNKTGAQFKLDVIGLPPEMVEMGPGPILFPNAEKEVPIKFIHPMGPRPPAGELRVVIRAVAPDAYPGQSASIAQFLNIAPYYSHKLELTPAT